MIKNKEEQKAASALQKANIIVAILAFIPAILCWCITCDMWFMNHEVSSDWPNGYSDEQKTFFAYESILLLIFYLYTIFYPLFFDSTNQYKMMKAYYWFLVLITNMLAALLFMSIKAQIFVIIPAIPFLFALNGIVAHYKLSDINSNDTYYDA